MMAGSNGVELYFNSNHADMYTGVGEDYVDVDQNDQI
jgi:hypothetical protein